jgi:hypothetical protein
VVVALVGYPVLFGLPISRNMAFLIAFAGLGLLLVLPPFWVLFRYAPEVRPAPRRYLTPPPVDVVAARERGARPGRRDSGGTGIE